MEVSTEEVIDWLEYFGVSYVRLNGEDLDGDTPFAFNIRGQCATIEFPREPLPIQLDKVRMVWYRRWRHSDRHHKLNFLQHTDSNSPVEYVRLNAVKQLDLELGKISHFLFCVLGGADWLGNPRMSVPNKLLVLMEAAKVGLDTPATLITTDKQQLRDFAEEHGSIVTKPCSDAPHLLPEDGFYFTYTAVLSPQFIDHLPSQFFPSLFQARLEKEFDLRIFFLEGQCYSMAIFSQADQQTTVDFREYNYDKPNRSVPYLLPHEVHERLTSLMNVLGLDSGSIDMVKTTDGRYVFLEVNPVGQFGMVSNPCNYFLERRIAERLARGDGDEKGESKH